MGLLLVRCINWWCLLIAQLLYLLHRRCAVRERDEQSISQRAIFNDHSTEILHLLIVYTVHFILKHTHRGAFFPACIKGAYCCRCISVSCSFERAHERPGAVYLCVDGRVDGGDDDCLSSDKRALQQPANSAFRGNVLLDASRD